MPITSDELRHNYYLACVVYCCGYSAPYTSSNPATPGQSWQFKLRDNGGVPAPQPYIYSWNAQLIGQAQPTDEYMLAHTTMAEIVACHDALYPSAHAADGVLV